MPQQAIFIGSREHSLDEKNRITLPSIFRERVDPKVDGKSFYITVGLDQCLFLYTHTRWQELAERLRKEPFTKKAAREFHRLFFGMAAEAKTDKAGRILIPDNLRTLARLHRQTLLMGVDDHIEIWDPNVWKEKSAGGTESIESLAEQLFQGNIPY